MLPFFFFLFFTFNIEDVLKFKCKTPVPKRLMKIGEENLCVRRKQALNHKEYSATIVDEFVES
jgi:hypothetical protein